MLNNKRVIYSVDGNWRQTGFTGSCPGLSAYSTWTGLGGANSPGLVQQGTDISPASGNSAPYAWWEALDAAAVNPEVAFSGSSSFVFAGTAMDASTTFDNLNGNVYFSVSATNIGNGNIFSANFTTYQGQTAAQYWSSANTAEWINERPSYNGTFTNLRQPALGTTAWGGAGKNSVEYSYGGAPVPMSTLSPMTVDMYNGSKLLASMPNSLGGSNTWSDRWHACQ